MTEHRAFAALGLGSVLCCFAAGTTGAATVGDVATPCNNACSYSIAVGPVGGQETTVTTGTFNVDPVSGLISLNPINWQSAGTSASLSLHGNSDPILGFNFSAGTAGTSENFSLTLSMPIALAGRISANSSVDYTLTALSGAGASITPTAGHVVTAVDLSTLNGGPPPFNKGVDVGDAFSFIGGPITHSPSQAFTASDMFTLAAGYNLMSVTLDFTLSANSEVGISGFVQQTAVPLPPALLLFLSGACLIWGLRRKPLQVDLPAFI
ncbi:MAG TPA: hypothetical protein VN815_14325 [Steroidobacteraceae bacterium]|nr:hypothetical protein [Steroidobacteraceae bacterium]